MLFREIGWLLELEPAPVSWIYASPNAIPCSSVQFSCAPVSAMCHVHLQRSRVLRCMVNALIFFLQIPNPKNNGSLSNMSDDNLDELTSHCSLHARWTTRWHASLPRYKSINWIELNYAKLLFSVGQDACFCWSLVNFSCLQHVAVIITKLSILIGIVQ